MAFVLGNEWPSFSWFFPPANLCERSSCILHKIAFVLERCPTIVNSSQIFPCSIIISVSLFLSVRHLTRFSAEKEKKKTTEKCLDRHVVFPSFFRPGGNSGGFSPPSISLLLLPKRGKKLEKHSSDPSGLQSIFSSSPKSIKRTKAFFLTFFSRIFSDLDPPPPSSVIGRVIFPRFKSGEIGLWGEKGCVCVEERRTNSCMSVRF